MKGLSDRDREVLAYLERHQEGCTVGQVKEDLKFTKRQYANYFLKKLKDKGYILKENRFYFFVHSESNIKPEKERILSDSHYKTIPDRIHAWGLGYDLKDPLPLSEPVRLFKLAGFTTKAISLKNKVVIGQVSVGHITARLTSKGLDLYSKDIYTDNRTESIDMEASLKNEFDEIAKDMERKLQRITNIKLVRLDKDILVSHIIRQHYAEEHHPAAQASPTSPLVLALSPIDKQKRLGVDMSKGFREWELYHKLSADVDKDVIDKEFNQLLDGKINLLDLNKLKELIWGIGENQRAMNERQREQDIRMEKFSREIEVHRRVWVKVDKKLSQKRLFDD